MKETGLMFKAPLVRAILSGQKTQTRRIAKDVRHPDLGNWYAPGALVLEGEPQHVIHRACPLGQPGYRIYVRETWAYGVHAQAAIRDEDGPFVYAADGTTQGRLCERWRPSIHMPKHAARIWLEITGVRVERLQAISEEDAKAEGVDATKYHGLDRAYARAFSELWESTGGDWAANPWVWVIDFKRIDQPAPKEAP
ncbi:ASCH domain-containing protein [Comamonas sp. MYb396]|uniref:ASCH domain-containing protein n=1 Tax=Comamonas sp. MYb396 TaxID=2745302 RepID=UPI0030B4A146